jgi:High potential iron-sulfur protein
MTSHRHIICAIPAATLALALHRKAYAQPDRIEASDPLPVSLGYKHDAGEVDAKKFTAYLAGRNYANCQLYQAKPTAPSGACAAVRGKLMNRKGWCVV